MHAFRHVRNTNILALRVATIRAQQKLARMLSKTDRRLTFVPFESDRLIRHWSNEPPVWQPPLKRFYNIDIVPSTDTYGYPNVIANGGPIFTKWAEQEAYRYRLHGKAVDKRPQEPDNPEQLTGEYLWGCYARPHFGHLVSEHMSRVLVSVSQRPDIPLLVVSDPIRRPQGAHPSFWEICNYFGVPNKNIRIVTQPIRVDCLLAAEAPEHEGSGRPDPGYLRLLDQNFARNRITPKRARILYVTRVGMVGKFRGGHLGEAYVQSLLRRCGVKVMDPASADLREQLARYAGAQTIVFAEGSSVHGRQLLGFVPQDLVILNRRPERRMASAPLRARANDLRYIEATTDTVAPTETTGRLRGDAALSRYDLPALFSAFDAIGVDIRARWDQQAYLAACLSDIDAWCAAMADFADVIDIPATMADVSAFRAMFTD